MISTHQIWDKLLFLHWEVPADSLRALIPSQLELDLFDGRAYIGVVPFTMRGVRPAFVPALPGLSESHELNVRTYVTCEGVPGVWFFSLDAANPVMVWGARLGFNLPYYHARMDLVERGATIFYSSHRRDTRSASRDVHFEVTWTRGGDLGYAESGTLQHFLTERYCLYSMRGNVPQRVRIEHRSWPLQEATVSHLSSTMIAATGIDEPRGAPVLHALREPLHVKTLSA